MSAPERIYLQDYGDPLYEATWCDHRIEDDDVEYVRADLVPEPEVGRLTAKLGPEAPEIELEWDVGDPRAPEPETSAPHAPTWRGATEPCEACGAPAGVVCPEASDRCRAICSCPTCSPAPTAEGGER